VSADSFGALRSSANHEWGTPRAIFDPLHAEFGFTVDAAASAQNALLPRFWSYMDDGLAQDWDNEIVWCNPPYGLAQRDFIRKAAESRGTSVLLIPARTDTRVWHEFIHGMAEVRFLRGRVSFIGNPATQQPSKLAPFPSAIVVFRQRLRSRA
jgi:site-specific DNA-methyltransferase (adenine-specific)